MDSTGEVVGLIAGVVALSGALARYFVVLFLQVTKETEIERATAVGFYLGLTLVIPAAIAIQASGPPQLVAETEARSASGAFADYVAAPAGGIVQASLRANNIGSGTARQVSLRIGLPLTGLRLIPGSCRVRTSDAPDLSPCDNNIVNGGFVYSEIGSEGWVQIYADLRMGPGLEPGRSVSLIGYIDSDETEETRDQVTVTALDGD